MGDCIKRPDNLVRAKLELEFNYRLFHELECDLDHINKNERSNFSLLEVMNIVASLLTNIRLAPIAEKDFNGEICSYFRRAGFYEMKKFKLIFCIFSDRPAALGIITLHRI